MELTNKTDKLIIFHFGMMERIAELVREGYQSGEIFADSGTESKDGYRGWWFKRKS